MHTAHFSDSGEGLPNSSNADPPAGRPPMGRLPMGRPPVGRPPCRQTPCRQTSPVGRPHNADLHYRRMPCGQTPCRQTLRIQTPPGCRTPMKRKTDTSENITLPQTSSVSGKDNVYKKAIIFFTLSQFISSILHVMVLMYSN